MPTSCPTEVTSHYGKFATTSRLISCLVIENLAPAYFYPSEGGDGIIGLCLVSRVRNSSGETLQRDTNIPGSIEDFLAIVPLRGIPVLDKTDTLTLNGVRCPKIELVDPWDMLPHIYGLSGARSTIESSQKVHSQVVKLLGKIGFQGEALVDGYDAVQLWNQFSRDYGVTDVPDAKAIAAEVGNSILHQTHMYDHPKDLPTLQSPPYVWEQRIFEGHPYHPMHKLRITAPPLPPIEPGQYDWDTPKLRLLALPKDYIQTRGDFETRAIPLIDAMLKPTGDPQEQRAKYADHVFMPAHEFQVPNIQEKFKNVVVFPEVNSVTAHSLTSIRTVAVPDVLPGYSVKTAIPVKVTSALRIISVYSTYFGPGFSANIVPRLTYDRSILTVERDLASAIYRHDDPNMAKHCSCILREAVEYPADTSATDDAFIVTGSLVEKVQKPNTDETLVTHVWKLDTEEKREAFLDRYVQLALKAFIPPCRENGLAFEAHGQNTLARFDKKSGELQGFVIRDFGGISIHKETLERTCGAKLDVLPDSSVVAASMDLVYNRLYHSLFHTHLQRLIRVLGMHHNGRGWEMVRRYFSELVPKSDPMYAYFMEQDKVSGKCLLTMKLDGLYRDDIFRPFPNVILTCPRK